MNADFDLDTREFGRAMVQYQRATGKDCADILNRAGRNVAFRAANKTPRAQATRIRADLMRDDRLRYALTSIALRKQGVGVVKSPEFRQHVQRFIARRVASAGYIRSGWAEAIEALGGTFRGRKVGKGNGWASKASIMRLITEIANTVPGIDKIGAQALQEAVTFVARDMMDFANNRLAQTAKAHSA